MSLHGGSRRRCWAALPADLSPSPRFAPLCLFPRETRRTVLPRGVLEPGAVLQELLELWQSLGAWRCPECSSQGSSGHLRWSCCSLEPAQPLGSWERPPKLRQQPPALAQGHAAAAGMVSLLRAKAPGLARPPASSSSGCCCAPCTTLMSPPHSLPFP